MLVEQRIAELTDRTDAEAISVANLVYKDTIDDRTTDQLFEKRGLSRMPWLHRGCDPGRHQPADPRLSRARMTPEQQERRIDLRESRWEKIGAIWLRYRRTKRISRAWGVRSRQRFRTPGVPTPDTDET